MTLAEVNEEAIRIIALVKECNATEALQAVNYEKVNLKEVAKGCKNLTNEQKVKLLAVLKQQMELFLGCQGEWKGNPTSIKVVQGEKLHRPRHIPSHSKTDKFLRRGVHAVTLKHGINSLQKK